MYGDAVAGSTVKMAGRRWQRHTGITDGGGDEDSDDYTCGGSGSIDPIPTEVCDGVGVGRRRRDGIAIGKRRRCHDEVAVAASACCLVSSEVGSLLARPCHRAVIGHHVSVVVVRSVQAPTPSRRRRRRRRRCHADAVTTAVSVGESRPSRHTLAWSPRGGFGLCMGKSVRVRRVSCAASQRRRPWVDQRKGSVRVRRRRRGYR